MKAMWRKMAQLGLFCVLVLLVPMQTFAAGAIDLARDVHFSIVYRYGGEPISDAKFDIYRVADVDAYARMTLTSRFAGYPIQIGDNTQSDWEALATTLKGYVWADKLTPDNGGTTDENGQITATLKPGLYLVVGYRRTVGEVTYSALPFLVFLPESDLEQNSWQYDVAAYPKADGEKNPSDDPNERLITRKVLKIWDDAKKESSRPKEITVHLMCDGAKYDTVKLNAENNWRYAWDNLERNHDWLITEEPVSGYTQAVSIEGITFTVKNKANAALPTDPAKPGNTKLPQTGQLWWPVIPLFVTGALLVGIGLARRKEDRHA